ncbi:MAG: hypothetical protein RBS40_02470 [Rhodocyclaceae bacterium]|nr:hypothetical protein [Rhodocyclaceae bacterium]
MIRKFDGRRTSLGCVAVAFAVLGWGGARAEDDVDALFDVGAPQGSGLKWGGYGELGLARTYADPEHWSKMRGRLELGGSGKATGSVKWVLSVRADADLAYGGGEDFYPTAVKRDQRSDWMIRDAYVDISHGDWDYRLGRQQVVWGEMVGLFFADVVSARDVREFYLPEFSALRIPQWAARAEYFKDDFHAEFLWIPVPSFDLVGKPGAEFYPFNPGPGGRILSEDKPGVRPGNGNWGLRLSALRGGWDLSAFYYRSLDVSPSFHPLGAGVFEPRHDRLRQFGGTLAKDFGDFVLKGELVHTHGRSFNTFSWAAGAGMKASDTLDYVVGVDVPVEDRWRFNAQVFARVFYDRDPSMGVERQEPGASLLVNRRFNHTLEAEALLVSSLNRNDYMFRPKVIWKFAPDWRGQAGLDVFGGKAQGLFGPYAQRDRAYLEVRRDF